MWLYRLSPAVFTAIVAWSLTRVLAASTKVAVTTGICVLIFGFLSTGQAYIVRRRIFRRDMILQYGSPVVASVIVSLIIRIVHM